MYGLPLTVRFCQSCVLSNQRPNSSIEFKNSPDSPKETLHIDEKGVCDACQAAKQKREVIDWEKRDAELRALCDRHRSKDGRYDCLVPGSGGKDSFMAAHLLKYTYGMHPLTVTWAPAIYTPWGARNFQRWIHAGFDNYLTTPNGRMHRLLARLALERLFHPFQPFILGQKGLAPTQALRFGIPLIFYGEQESEYGNPIGEFTSAKRDWKFFTSHDDSQIYLGGTSLKELGERYGVERGELDIYLPPNPEKIEKAGIEVHYLGYYVKWHPQGAYYYASEHGGFEASPERTPGTYSKYNSIDDKIDDLHYWTTFVKFGIGRATYDASQEVRSGDITREEGVALVKRFDGEFPEKYFQEVMDYIGMKPERFLELCDQFRSPHLWEQTGGTWALRQRVS